MVMMKMTNKKLIVTAIAAAIVLSMQAGSVFAAEVSDSDLDKPSQVTAVAAQPEPDNTAAQPEETVSLSETEEEIPDSTELTGADDAETTGESDDNEQEDDIDAAAAQDIDDTTADEKENFVGWEDVTGETATENGEENELIAVADDETQDEPTREDIQAMIDSYIAQAEASPEADEEEIAESRQLLEGLLEEITGSDNFVMSNATMTDVQDYLEMIASGLLPEESEPRLSGKCGDNLTWRFDKETATLTISGSGEMYDLDDVDTSDDGWFSFSEEVEHVVFDGSITSIGSGAFLATNVEQITIPATVKRVADGAFGLNEALQRVDVAEGSETYASADGVLYNKDMTELLLYPVQKADAAFTVPDTVTKVGNSAFAGNSHLTDAVIPDSVKVIDDGAFSNCRYLTNVTLGDSVTTIGNSAFFDCVRLDRVTLGQSVQEIDYMAFYSSGITEITLPHWIQTVKMGAFSDCALTDVYYIGTQDEWEALGLDELAAPEGYEYPRFHFTPAESYEKPAELQKIERETYKLSEEDIAEMEEAVEEWLEEVKASDELTPEQTEVVETFLTEWLERVKALGSDDPAISEQAFDDLASFMQDFLSGIMEQFMDEIETSGQCGENLRWAFDKETGVLTISGEGDMYDYAPADEEEEEASFDDENAADDIDPDIEDADWEMSVEDRIKEMTEDFFMMYADDEEEENLDDEEDEDAPWLPLSGFIKNVQFAGNVTSIGRGAFLMCSFPTIDIPASIRSIGENSVDTINGLVSFNVSPDNVNYSSEDGVLFDKSRETLLRYPENKTDAGYTVPETVKAIAASAFSNCRYLTSVVIPDSVKTLGEYAFAGCGQLKEAVIGSGIKRIEEGTFYNCFKLNQVTIPQSVTFISAEAFDDCNLKDVYYLGTEKNWQTVDLNEDPEDWESEDGFETAPSPFANAVFHYQEQQKEETPVPAVISDGKKGTAVVNAAQTDTANPKTGDASDALPLMAMAESAFIAAIAMAIAKQRNKNEA